MKPPEEDAKASTDPPLSEPAAPPTIPPVATPDAPAPAAPQPTRHTPVNAGLVVLQWLTYAFWGWTVLALSVLTSMVVANFINDTSVGSGTAYGIAAVLVLLPISYICDHFYSKREPARKTGPETLVMVIHAVLFALFGIGALIVGVFSIVSLLTSNTDTKDTITVLICSLIITAYYGATFLRALNPIKFGWIKNRYKLVMLVSVSIIIVLGIAGPVARERQLRDDRLIENSLNTVSDAITNYASSNKKLPDNLEAIGITNDNAKQLIDRKLVEYKPEGSVTSYKLGEDSPITRPGSSPQQSRQVFRYQLCVTFKEESNDYSRYDNLNGPDDDGYSSYLSVYYHPAGRQCYKLKTSDY
jgi:hypothetical protein